jgi:hypothetical protein
MRQGGTGRTSKEALQPESITLTVNGQVHELGIGARPGEVQFFHTLSHTPRRPSDG